MEYVLNSTTLNYDDLLSNEEALWPCGETAAGEDCGPDLLIGKARIARQMNRRQTAIKAYKQAINSAPNRADIRNELAFYYVQEPSRLTSPADLEEAKTLAEAGLNLSATAGSEADINPAKDTLAWIKILLAQRESDPARQSELADEAEELLDEIDLEDLQPAHRQIVEHHKKVCARLNRLDNRH